MSAETFFARWSQRKAETVERSEAGPLTQADAAASAPAEAVAKPPPTLDDVAALTHESDFTPFVARGVDETVRRSAMKKLFTDPHFNVMDGLDTYIGDYNKFEPIPPEMLAALNHAKDLLNPLALLQRMHPTLYPRTQLAPAAGAIEAAATEAAAIEAAAIEAAPPAAPTDATPPPESHDDSIQSL